jgi:hypothetical protein
MSLHNNPFVRGYWGLHVQRVLEIHSGAGASARWPLHPSQKPLSDDEIVSSFCVSIDGFAWVAGGRETFPDKPARDCLQGVVHAVRHAIHARDGDRIVSLGEVSSQEEASEIVRRLRFETGFYSRSWEISSDHLNLASFRYLRNMASSDETHGPLFHVFSLSSGSLGVKLIGTPWNDVRLLENDNSSVRKLRQAQLKFGVPQALVEVLHLAGEADVRFLIFDRGAARLPGLPVYGDDE